MSSASPLIPINSNNFYVVGGTMQHGAPSYVERQADDELFYALRRGEYCHVLTARQMGKSSLLIHTAARLRAAGMAVAVLDLTAIGQHLTPEQWYGGLLLQIGQRLGLEDELLDFWVAQRALGPLQRWLQALRQFVLPQFPDELVIFVDEVDAVRSLPFATDEFFAGIRMCYNQRSEDPLWKRLTFCLSGVALPSDLIRDTRTTPFNIGRRIELHDFDATEIQPLAAGLGRTAAQNEALLRRIYYWTGGHPYLTQRLCQAVVEQPQVKHPTEIDTLCQELFLARRAQERDDNLLFVRELLLRSETDVTALLELYARIRRRRPVTDTKANPLLSTLRLSGIVRSDGPGLRVRNRIYERVFDLAWVEASLPEAELRRQRAAYWRGVWRMALVSACLLLLLGGLAFQAIRQSRRATQQAAANRRLLYLAQMKVVQQEWEMANLSRVEELLTAQIPQAEEPDLRGFEWHLFWQLTHGELFQHQEKYLLVNAHLRPDGHTVLYAGAQRANANGNSEYLVKQLDLKGQQPGQALRLPAGQNFNVLAFSPDLRLVAVDGAHQEVTCWDLASGQLRLELKGHQAALTALSFAPAGQWLASADLQNVVKLWESGTGKLRASWRGPASGVTALAFAPDGQTLAVADESDTVRLYACATAQLLSSVRLPGNVVQRALFYPDGKRLLLAVKTGRLYSAAWQTGRLGAAWSSVHQGEITAAAFSPDGFRLATGGTDRTVVLWNAETAQPQQIIRGHGSVINAVTWAADSRLLLTCSDDGSFKVWQPRLDEPVLPGEAVGSYLVTRFGDRDEALALGETAGHQLKLWNLSTGQELCSLDGTHTGPPEPNKWLCAAFSPNGRWAAAAGVGGAITLWDLATGRVQAVLQGHRDHVYNLDFSPDSHWLISGGKDQTLRLWELATGREAAALSSQRVNSYRAVFAPNGQQLASATSEGQIQIWELASRRVLNVLSGHHSQVRTLAFSPDGTRLVSSGLDNTLRLWDVATGQELKRLGSTDVVLRAAFSRDGLRLITGGQDGAVKIWDLAQQHEIMNLKGHADEVSSIAFSASGASLVTSGKDGTVRLWRTTPPPRFNLP